MAIDLTVQVSDVLQKFDFDSRKIKPVMRKVGTRIRKDSRLKLFVRSVKQNSMRGKYPKVLTGSMKKSITARVSKSGFSVGIMYDSTQRTRERGFYPAFLLYGVKGRIEKYPNPIQDALKSRSDEFTEILRKAIDDAIKPGLLK